MDQEPRLGTRNAEIYSAREGVLLWELAAEDAETYVSLVTADPEHFLLVGEHTPKQYASPDDFLATLDKRPNRKRFGIWAEGHMVGSINYELTDSDGVFVGYWVGKEYAGHGYAAKALRTVTRHLLAGGWQNIYAEVREDNVASRRTLENSGYFKLGPSIASGYLYYLASEARLVASGY